MVSPRPLERYDMHNYRQFNMARGVWLVIGLLNGIAWTTVGWLVLS